MTVKWYTVDEVAEILSVSPKTIRRRISDGAIRVFRDGGKFLRISEEALDEYLKAREQEATAPVPVPAARAPRKTPKPASPVKKLTAKARAKKAS